MAVLDDILKWSEADLSQWQQDALRRLFRQQGALSDADYDDLYAMLKDDASVPGASGPSPNPLSKSDLPATSSANSPVLLKELHDLKNVNNIAPKQRLIFSTNGLTVIYGDNGSGKSGYSRTLKSACRARDQSEAVIANAYNQAAHSLSPEAVFEIELSGKPHSIHWTEGSPPPRELSTIAVFDARCARSYLVEGEVAYLPYGLDIVESLGHEVLPKMRARLEAEIAAINVSMNSLPRFETGTAVESLLTSMSASTSRSDIECLATLTVAEKQELSDTESILNEPDALARANELASRSFRMKELANLVGSLSENVGDDETDRLKQLAENARVTAENAETAAKALRESDTLLAGTGGPLWRSMFEAARMYSINEAYPTHKFPHVGSDAVCSLCQQSVEDVKSRLDKFNEFVEADVTSKATAAEGELEAAIIQVKALNLSLGLNQALIAELDVDDESIVKVLTDFQQSAENRHKWLINGMQSGNWDNPPIVSPTGRKELRSIAAQDLRRSRQYRRASNPTKLAELKTKRAELGARNLLAQQLAPVLSLHDRQILVAKLEECRPNLNTAPISNKSKEFVTDAVSQTLGDALNDEFETIGIGKIKTKLSNRAQQGKTYTTLSLEMPSDHRTEDILSEGEQRAIAIGSFLAELQLADHQGPIVFDDPVSSLDHVRRRNVAKRLTREAGNRQVIIFTHDTTFLGEVMQEASQASVPCAVQSMEWEGAHAGRVIADLPWEHKHYKTRISALECPISE